MRVSSMSQLAAAVKETFATITVDRHTGTHSNINTVQPPVQSRYTDSVEFSEKALELLMGTDTKTNSKAELATDRKQKENPDENHQQEQPTPKKVIALNVFA
jgi:hypothetical protein